MPSRLSVSVNSMIFLIGTYCGVFSGIRVYVLFDLIVTSRPRAIKQTTMIPEESVFAGFSRW